MFIALWWWRGHLPARPETAPAPEQRDLAAGTSDTRPRPSLPARAASPATAAQRDEPAEDVVRLPSTVTVDGIDADRDWVCAGEPIALSARVSGAGRGVVYRWLWRGPDSMELHPGLAMRWRAPQTPGSYAVRFQACTDLGDRRVGVLAERETRVEVRACTADQSQHSEPLRLRVVQRGHGAFAFHADYQGEGRVEAYQWQLGDSVPGTTTDATTETTTDPVLEHTYATEHLGPHDTRSALVTVRARVAGEQRAVTLLEARAVVQIRGRPTAHERPAIELDIARWQPRRHGHDDGHGPGWDSELSVRSVEGDITWDRLERTTRYFDGREDTTTHPWTELIRVDETLPRGGFRGLVRVDAGDAPPEVKQIIDALYGHDVTGNELMISWTPFKRPSPDRDPQQPIPGK